ncbi:MAG: ribokinase [Verrucomicrobiales bacterium]|nr:ribokinase [Verrucomicrobiales bacterium]
MNRIPRICVVGSAMFDQVTRTPTIPRLGETLRGSSYHTGFGGKGANQAVTAARLGADVTLVARLGNDAIGKQTAKHYVAEGIRTEFVSFDDRLPSGVAPIWVEESSGQNCILVVPGANQALQPADVRQAAGAIRAAQVVLCQLEIPWKCSLEAFRIAREQGGTITLLNPAPPEQVPAELLAVTDLLAPNESEATALTGIPVTNLEEAERAARALQSRGPQTVVITLGAQGALALTPGGEILLSSAPAVQAVDTTGAGDCFIGSLAFFLSMGLALGPALQRACHIASRSVLTQGTQTSFPRRSELDPDLFSDGTFG